MTMTSRRAVLADADPVYAAIERFKAAHTEYPHAEPSPKSPRHKAWERKELKWSDKCGKAKDAMLRTVPTTRDGARAVVSAVIDAYYVNFKGPLPAESARVLVETFAKAIPAQREVRS